jgi:hypothetical protein
LRRKGSGSKYTRNKRASKRLVCVGTKKLNIYFKPLNDFLEIMRVINWKYRKYETHGKKYFQ